MIRRIGPRSRSMFEIVALPILVALSVAVLAYFSALLFGAVRQPLAQATEQRRIARHLARANRCDELLESGQIEPALREIQATFYLYPLDDQRLGAKVANLHTGLLSRVIAITSEGSEGVRLLSLAKTDRLLGERAVLQKRYFASRQSGAPGAVRRLDRDLAMNAQELARALDQLVEEALAARRQRERLH